MERYSDRAIEIINELHRERLDYQSEYLPLIDAANKLSAYEDTGLEPEQVMSATIDPESLHRERTVATNADCIRSMSDERLADQLVIDVNGLASCRLYLAPTTGKLYRIRTEAVKEVKEWLQQPTEEG